MNLSYHFAAPPQPLPPPRTLLWFMPLWFKETNLTQPWVCGENKWVKFFRLPGDRKEDGRKLLEKHNYYCNRPAVLWISHNYLTIWVNAGMLSLAVSTCACTYREDPLRGCNKDRLSSLCACMLITVLLTSVSHCAIQISRMWIGFFFVCLHAHMQCWRWNPRPCAW